MNELLAFAAEYRTELNIAVYVIMALPVVAIVPSFVKEVILTK